MSSKMDDSHVRCEMSWMFWVCEMAAVDSKDDIFASILYLLMRWYYSLKTQNCFLSSYFSEHSEHLVCWVKLNVNILYYHYMTQPYLKTLLFTILSCRKIMGPEISALTSGLNIYMYHVKNAQTAQWQCYRLKSWNTHLVNRIISLVWSENKMWFILYTNSNKKFAANSILPSLSINYIKLRWYWVIISHVYLLISQWSC
jgi:hypothetical protein